MNKLVVIVTSVFVLAACKKETPSPTAEPPVQGAVDLVDKTKGFHKIYRYFEAESPANSSLKAVAMTTEGANKLNVAFVTDVSNSVLNRSLQRFSVDYTNGVELKATTKVPILWTTYFEKEFYQFAPYSDLLAYGYVHLTSHSTQGDIKEGTGMLKQTGSDGRIAKNGHLTVNPFYFSDGIDRGDIYSTMVDGRCKTYWDGAGYTGNSPFNAGIFEPIAGTNEGVLIAAHADSVNAYTRALTDTVKYRAVRNHSQPVSKSMSMLSNTGKGTLIKNTTNSHDFSFAIYGVDGMNRQLIFWTFTYSYDTKKITKVIDGGVFTQNEVLAFDIDTEGNFYCIKTDGSVYKTTAAARTTIATNIVLAGKPTLLKVYNNKVFIAISNVTTSRQLDIVVQD